METTALVVIFFLLNNDLNNYKNIFKFPFTKTVSERDE